MAIKKMSQIKWEEAQEKMISLGVRVVTDRHPTTTVSGYRDGGRFSLCWLDETATAVLEIEKILDPELSKEDLFVKTLSDLLIGSEPFCIYQNQNRKNLYILEWRRKDYQAARLEIIKGMRDVVGLKEL